MTHILILLILFLTFIACITDVRGMRIPNIIPALIMGLFVFHVGYVCVFGNVSLWFFSEHFIAGAGIFILTFILFACNIFGAGDAKLATAIAFWVGLKNLPSFLFFMTVTGGILGIIALIIMKKGVPVRWQKGWLKVLSQGQADVPYAIAIFVGAVMGVLVQNP